MGESADDRRDVAWELLFITALMGLGYLCMRTLRFTNNGLNLAYVCGFFLIPFFAARLVLRLRRWPRMLLTVLLVPLLALSMVVLLLTVSCDIPAYVQHREFTREIGSVQQGQYSVHLLWEETAGGALGPHGVGLEQRMFIVRGLYVVKHLDYFEGASKGSVSAEGPDEVRLYIPESSEHVEVNKVYTLKRRVYWQ